MRSGSALTFLSDTRGAVAATYALAIPVLVAIAGVGMDYGRMVALDTELQNAADQASLAAVTQLDGSSGSMERAISAAQGGLVSNFTRMGNDGDTPAIDVPTATVIFYTTRANAEAGTNGFTDTTRFAEARFVQLNVETRGARYALTPLVGAFGTILSAQATAGIGSAICKVPPVMICNPSETLTNLGFDAVALRGAGLRLVSVGGGNGGWAPGNFGYLNNNGGSNGAPGIREGLGWNTPPGDCLAQTGVNTKPGASVSVTDALNTRFDVYDSNVSCPTGGSCGASINSVKDLVRPANANGGNACRLHNSGWQEVPSAQRYLPTSATTALPVATVPGAMGHPRDMCHAVDGSAAGACTGPVGNGLWDRDAYFRSHYLRSSGTRWTAANWQFNTGLPSNATRYEVYKWEYEHRGNVVDGVTVLGPNPAGATGNTKVAYGAPQCSAGQGYGSGIVPAATVPDRRRISVAVVNCTAASVNGSSTNVPVVKWIDVFLVQPSVARDRTSAGDIYGEVIGETQSGAGQTAGQVVRRDVPYIIR